MISRRFWFRRHITDHDDDSPISSSLTDEQVEPADSKTLAVNDKADDDALATETELPGDVEEVQGGVRRMEAVTLSWTKGSLAIAYLFMWLLYFVNAFQSSITNNLTAYVLSGFQSHSLIPAIAVVTNVMCSVTFLPVAKILNLWGRPTGFGVMAGLATLGLVLMATTTRVETYAAAQVFYLIGFTGMIYSVDVITADTSALKDRGLAYAFTASPYIITAFAGPSAAQGFYENISWRWAFGTFAIILPCVAGSFVGLLLFNESKAKQNGLIPKTPSGRTWIQIAWFYLVEFDALGIVLVAAGMVLFLLPFSLAGSTADSWRSPSIIAMLVVGFVLLIAFALVERYLARVPFIPYRLLISSEVICVLAIDVVYQIAYYCWGSYFSSYLQVVYGLTITQAGWIGGVYDVIAGVWLLLAGWLIRRTLHFKWLLVASTPIYALGIGLMIYFRQPSSSIGYIIMCQVFIALSGGTITLCNQVAILAVAQQQDLASLLALLNTFGWLGGAVGNSISGAIWTNTLPEELQKRLPADIRADWNAVYEDITEQLKYPKGTPERDAIIAAYAVAQTRMLITGTAIMAIAIVSAVFIRNTKLDRKQTKGMVL